MHAVLISAYRDFETLALLVDRLRAEQFAVLVHIDAKSAVPAGYEAELSQKGCFVSRRHRIYWGSYTHLLAILELMTEALREPSIEYLHTISGQDWPLMNGDAIRAACDGTIFALHEPIERIEPAVRAWFERYKLLHRLEHIHVFRQFIDKGLFALQRYRRTKRASTADFGAIYKGLVWMSLPAAAARHVLQAEPARRYLEDMRTVYVPEEFYFQTVLMNSPFAGNMVDDARRYMVWEFKHGVKPAMLDSEDFDGATRSDAFFMRKVSLRYARSLIERLDLGEPA
jgi:hypothetical protein